jgi:2-methylcitrate dehydratase
VASANAARNAVYAALLARNGMEGPVDLFEGQKGWKQVISGDFELDLDPGCESVFDTMTKLYVAETYAQSAVEGVIELAEEEDIDPGQVEEIRLATFAGAKLIIGGGEGSRHEVETKAQADHSLPYMLAAALVDRDLTKESYDPERIHRDRVQSLLRAVEVEEDEELTERFESGDEMPAVVDVVMDDGTTYRVEKSAFLGHPSNPMGWDGVEAKFRTMAGNVYDDARQDETIEVVRDLENRETADLVAVLTPD